MDRKQSIINWTETHKKEFLRDLTNLCAIRSVEGEAGENAPFGPGPAAALKEGFAVCDRAGFATKNYDWYAGAADLCPDKPAGLDILAHLDVVGEGNGWDTDPYAVVLKEDGCVYGRGVADDKGGVLTAIYAMRCVRDLGIPLKTNCRLIMGTNEESGSSDIDYYYTKEKAAPCTCTPDSTFPVCNVEKGTYRMEFRKHWAGQTAKPRVTKFDGGFRVNVVPTEATALIAGMAPDDLARATEPLCAELGVRCRVEADGAYARITVAGLGCHAASPELGNNGSTALVRVLSELPLADCPSTRALHELNETLPHGDYYGKALGVAQEDEVSGPLTCSFTQLNFDENGLWGLCDMRVPVCAGKENCRDVAESKMSALGFAMGGGMTPPHYTPADTPFIAKLLKCWETYTGRPGICYSMGGGTYVHDVPGGVAFGIEMPGFETNMHGANECARLDDLLTSVEIYAQAIADICGEND